MLPDPAPRANPMNTSSPAYEIDARTCIRCAACATVAPAHFTVGAGPAKVVRPPSKPAERYACDAAVRLCPTKAVLGGDSAARERPKEPQGSVVDLYSSLGEIAEGVRWKISDLPWSSFDASVVTPELREVVRSAAAFEQTTYSATQKFMEAFADEPDFTQWVSVWFYEETRHPMSLMRWLSLAGESFDADFVARSRVSAPFMKSRTGTLIINVISEIVAATAYMGMANDSPEPLLSAIARRIAADEGRHSASFFRFAQRRIAQTDDIERERLDALKVLYFWLNDSQNVSHPVNQAMEKVRRLRPEAGRAPGFVIPNERICQVVGQLVDLDIGSPSDVRALFTQQALRAHAEA